MTTSIVEVIQHYQRSIDNSQDNEARLLHCINKLYKLPIKVEHLQETGVGKTVNSLRKFNGEIGVAAKTLVTKWKAMVAAEEEPMDTTSQTYENDTQHHNDNDEPDPSPNDNMHIDEDENRNSHSGSRHSNHSEKEKHKDRSHSSSSSSHNNTPHKESSSKHSSSKHSNEHKSSSSSSSSKRDKESHHKSSSKDKEKGGEHKSRDKHKDKHHEKDREHSEKRKEEKQKSDKEISNHKDSSSKEEHKHKSSSKERDSSEKEKHKERSEKHHKSSSKDKHKEKDKNKEKNKEEKQASSSSSKDKHKSSSSPSSTKDSTQECRKRHNSDTESSDFKSPLPKIAKTSHKSSGKLVENGSSPPQDANEGEEEDGFDSTMGTNFDDILGMLDKPVKKSKKSNKTSTPGSSCSSGGGGSSKESPPKPSTSSQRKNDLLASSAKLEPLDPSIALELPTISTNYRPMPLNQTVMDCVFNTSSSSSSRPPVRTMSDADALQHGISSKTIRTKIYSGTKTGQIYQVPSLFDMCIRILQKNIDALEYTGGVPFEVLRPVLERATPQQLFIFEDYNPYLMEDSDVLWQIHVSRNYRTQKRLENESWREMFMRCQEEEERRLSFLKDSIKASQKIAAAPVRKTQLAFVDSMVKPPRNVQRKQEQYGTKSKMVATPAARVAALQSVTPNAAKTGDQRLKVPSTVRDHAQVSHSSVRPKKAPLMQKTLAFMRGRLKR
ncbi:transcription elongation factor B polypeptide 3 [Musca vetustissima]|uniref:transcription elongation factor B polypeptide 3 n=1 Tax=Musca vetustissima TaxID=27455 RepID=UPI002AB673B0|nr:transcription elongation factor B polypeptide 3 [Musca vetustissima]